MNDYTVLIAEDEPLLLKDIENKIEALDAGFCVAARASDGSQALEQMIELQCDVLITDIKMPVMNGLDLIQKVSTLYPHTKIIVLSGYADFEFAKTAMRSGVFDYLLKPLKTEELESALNSLKVQLSKERNITDTEYVATSPKQIIDLVKEYVKENYAQPIEFGTLAAQFGFTAAYLTKVFSRSEGIPPLKYLTDLRLGAAKRLLATTSLSIKAVGESVGYPDQFYFSKLFKQSVGMSPLQYRKSKE